jgi:3-deoxy-7-phosphoheptulonate synthase
MSKRKDSIVENTNVISIDHIISPQALKDTLVLDEQTKDQICNWRSEIENIVSGKDKRLLVIVGPCSIHDTQSALDYAHHVKKFRTQFSDKIFIVMRVYFEKPRTTIGWKGLINDPRLDGTYDINYGLKEARSLLLQINQMGVPTGCEFLDVFTPQYYADLVSWGAIGARTTESQLHRELASGLSMTIGFKNGTDGSILVAAEAIQSASSPHVFLGIDTNGHAAIVKTTGNKSLQIILRGSTHGSNYDHVSIANVNKLLRSKNINTRILIDCSHGNSGKNYKNQPIVLESVMNQIENGEQHICGFMIESHIYEGNQKHTVENGKQGLQYGKSITDECINIGTTYKMLERIASIHFTYFE